MKTVEKRATVISSPCHSATQSHSYPVPAPAAQQQCCHDGHEAEEDDDEDEGPADLAGPKPDVLVTRNGGAVQN